MCDHITRSVMAAEVHAMMHAVDVGMIVEDALNELLNRSREMETFVNRQTIFNVVTKHSNTVDIRLQIDVLALREIYKILELKLIGWIEGKPNPVDILAKEALLQVLSIWELIGKNKLRAEPVGWAIRRRNA